MTRSVVIVLGLAVVALYLCEAHQGICIGGPNDVLQICGSACEPTCERPERRACIFLCIPHVCQCRRGYYRRESDLRCVRLSECKPQVRPRTTRRL